MQEYRPTIGLEIHAELKTKTKMFCDCANDPNETEPNANVCPICLAHPGTLPAINAEAVRHILRIGAALSSTQADYTEFDRKSYFYPDIPKGYQISQYERPLVRGGSLNGVEITRVHLEEDTARSMHVTDYDVSKADVITSGPHIVDIKGPVNPIKKSLIDFNRAGIPLMELVTEPVIHDATTAGNFARELQLLLRTLGAGGANLEKGEMRIEANISVSKDETLGTKVEVKNLNSFRAVERAIEYETQRHIDVLEKGGSLLQETRGWDEDRGVSFSQRLKEGSADYRYFPEPDLPKLILSELSDYAPEALRKELPELPNERRARYERDYSLRPSDSAFIVNETRRAEFMDAVFPLLSVSRARVLAANYFVSDLAGESGKASPEAYAALMNMLASDTLSSRGAKDVLAILSKEGGDPSTIAKERGLLQVSDEGALRKAVRQVIEENEQVAAEYRGGKDASLRYLVGATMKATKGAGNPSLIEKLLIEELGRG